MNRDTDELPSIMAELEESIFSIESSQYVRSYGISKFGSLLVTEVSNYSPGRVLFSNNLIYTQEFWMT